MPGEMNPNDLRKLWLEQEVEKVTITIEELRLRATRFERRIHWRNVREYVAGAIALVFFGARLWSTRGWALVPPLLLVAALIYVLVQLHRRAAARPLPADAGLRTSIDFHLAELTRQRAALHDVWQWYLLPFVPGFLAEIILAAATGGIHTFLVVFTIGLVVIYFGIWKLNESAVRKLDRKIAEIRSMTGNGE